LEALRNLENKGVEILICGTCLEYHDKMNDFSIGTVSNMYDILERMTKAGKILYS